MDNDDHRVRLGDRRSCSSYERPRYWEDGGEGMVGRPYWSTREPPYAAMLMEPMEPMPPYGPAPCGCCGAGLVTDGAAPGAGPAVNGSVAGGGTALDAWRLLCRIACLLFWNL